MVDGLRFYIQWMSSEGEFLNLYKLSPQENLTYGLLNNYAVGYTPIQIYGGDFFQ